MDEGTETEPIEIECPACNGGGCDECKEGSIIVLGCPNQYCKEVIPAIRLFDLFDKGMAPVAGGALDQSAMFLEAATILERDEAKIKAEQAK
jgi:hypothetical protein